MKIQKQELKSGIYTYLGQEQVSSAYDTFALNNIWFNAEMYPRRYRRLINSGIDRYYFSSPCLVKYVILIF